MLETKDFCDNQLSRELWIMGLVPENFCDGPDVMLYEAQKFFRQQHNIHIEIIYHDALWYEFLVKKTNKTVAQGSGYATYEDALMTAVEKTVAFINPVMTPQEFKDKWGDTDPWDIEDENVLRRYKEDCFKMWEKTGFKERYMSKVDPDEPYNNTPFKVLRRATEEEYELHCMPLWLVELYDGHTAYCGPDEICKL